MSGGEVVIYRPGKFGWHFGLCGICGYDKPLITDHCHRHGLVRGSLCLSCNTQMGLHDRQHGPDMDYCWFRFKIEGNCGYCFWWWQCRECFRGMPSTRLLAAFSAGLEAAAARRARAAAPK